jgi:hypothetical protein
MNNAQHRASRAVLAITLAWFAALVPGGAAAVEGGAIRMAPGWSGGELALPLLPGVTGTVGIMHYESKQLKDNDGHSPQVPVGAGLNAALSGSARATVVIPRIVWISEHKLFGGYLGAGALIPFFDRKQSFSLAGQFPPGIPEPAMAGIQSQLDTQSTALGGSTSAQGDLEIAPVISWPEERTSVVLAASMIFPTGKYDPASPLNAGSGNYHTFRPTLSVGYAGEGWDAGTRVAVAFNSRNRDTDVKSGTYLVMDGSLLKDFGGVRAGVQGYWLQQLESDEGPGVPPHGNKSRALALGPALSWTNADATWLVDAKILKEFGVRNRFEGRTNWLTVSHRF